LYNIEHRNYKEILKYYDNVIEGRKNIVQNVEGDLTRELSLVGTHV